MHTSMRTLYAVALVAALCPAFGQQDPVLLSGRPDIIVWVEKSDVGADYVRIQALSEDYPADLMRTQIEAVGRYNGSDIRGLEVSYSDSGGAGRILSATFATDNLMNANAGTLQLNPFAKAFAGAPDPHTVSILAVMFENFMPVENVTVAGWSDAAVEVSSHFDQNLRLVDYRVKLKTQDPEEISIPDTVSESTIREEAPSKGGLDPKTLAAIVVGALAIGLLVYFLLRPRGAKPVG